MKKESSANVYKLVSTNKCIFASQKNNGKPTLCCHPEMPLRSFARYGECILEHPFVLVCAKMIPFKREDYERKGTLSEDRLKFTLDK